MTYCPFCGAETEPHSQYCLNCGKKLPVEKPPVKGVPSWEQPPMEQRQTYAYTPMYQPRPYHPAMKAPLGDRCIALVIDGIINYFCCFYDLIKDGIREGQSIGKGFMNLRVVDFRTGMPATVGQSFMRNCFPGCLDDCCCNIVALIDSDGRRIGDHAAGTVVITDK